MNRQTQATVEQLSESVTIVRADCLDVLPIECDAIITDPPYYITKKANWDRQWKSVEEYIGFIRKLCEHWRDGLAKNGSLYCFASPHMAARVEVAISEYFNVLNRITWKKRVNEADTSGMWKKMHKESLRRYAGQKEEIIFAEHYGQDRAALGDGREREFVFEPLRAYLAGEMKRAGWTPSQIDKVWRELYGNKGSMSRHWFGKSQWRLPTLEHYEWLRKLFNNGRGDKCLLRDYEDLRKEYEELRKKYKELRRPFSVTPSVPYTDVWDFLTVHARKGIHPCEKPVAMLEHMIRTSTRPGALVLDCFMGSGSTGIACIRTGRRFIGVELDIDYYVAARRSLLKELNSKKTQVESDLFTESA